MSGNPGAGVGAGNAAGVCAGNAGAGDAIADDEDDGGSAGRHVVSIRCASNGGTFQLGLNFDWQGMLLQICMRMLRPISKAFSSSQLRHIIMTVPVIPVSVLHGWWAAAGSHLASYEISVFRSTNHRCDVWSHSTGMASSLKNLFEPNVFVFCLFLSFVFVCLFN